MEEYENYIRNKIIEESLIEELLDLENKNLGCRPLIVAMEMCW